MPLGYESFSLEIRKALICCIQGAEVSLTDLVLDYLFLCMVAVVRKGVGFVDTEQLVSARCKMHYTKTRVRSHSETRGQEEEGGNDTVADYSRVFTSLDVKEIMMAVSRLLLYRRKCKSLQIYKQ